MAEVKQAHRELAEEAADRACMGYLSEIRAHLFAKVCEETAQAIADAEQRGLDLGRREGWVSCEERMPEHGYSVMFWESEWLPSASPGLGCFHDNQYGQWWEDETQSDEDGPKRCFTQTPNTRGVTHWMPLPSPPVATEGGER